MKFLFNFGFSQDDAETERKALDLQPGDKVLCIASAGEVPLNLLAFSDVFIDAVDISLPQLSLAKLKLTAAIHLDPKEAARFLGYLPATTEERHRAFRHLADHLDPSERTFWKQHPEMFSKGAVNLGRFEQYLSRFNWLGLKILNKKKVLGLFSFDDVAEQREYFDRYLETRRVKLIFKIAFHPKIYRKRGMDEAGLIHSGRRNIADFFYAKFRDFCTATLARKNYFLQFMLFNRILFDEALPEYLSEEGNGALRKRSGQLKFYHTSITNYLKNQAQGAFNKFALSNIGDWMTGEEYAELLHLIEQKAQKPGRILLRYIHYAHKIPEDLQHIILPEYTFGQELEKVDRFPFYNLIPMSIKTG